MLRVILICKLYDILGQYASDSKNNLSDKGAFKMNNCRTTQILLNFTDTSLVDLHQKAKIINIYTLKKINKLNKYKIYDNIT